MATVSTEAISTLSEVKAALLRADAADELAEQVFTDGGNYDLEGVSTIEDTSETVRDYLRRDLYVQKWTPLLKEDDWERVARTPDSDYPFQLKLHRVPDWPILEAKEDVKVHEQRRIFAKDQDFDTLTLFAGYRREDLGASDYGVSSTLNDSEIPVFPSQIVQTVKRLSIHRAVQKVKGLIGVRSESQVMGEFQTEAQRTNYDMDYQNRQLKNVHSFRSVG